VVASRKRNKIGWGSLIFWGGGKLANKKKAGRLPRSSSFPQNYPKKKGPVAGPSVAGGRGGKNKKRGTKLSPLITRRENEIKKKKRTTEGRW